MKSNRIGAVMAGLLCLAATHAGSSWGVVGFGDVKEFMTEVRASKAPDAPQMILAGGVVGNGPAAGKSGQTFAATRSLRDILPGTRIKIQASLDTRWVGRSDSYFEYEPTLGDKIAHSFTLETMHYPSCRLWYGYSNSQNSTIVSKGRELTVREVQRDHLLGGITLVLSEESRPPNEAVIGSISCQGKWHADTDWGRAKRVIVNYPMTVGELLRTFRLTSGVSLFELYLPRGLQPHVKTLLSARP